MPRLASRTLTECAPTVQRPRYDRAAVATGIVHLGLGAFARAHLCEYTDDVLDAEPGPWGITGVSLRNPDQRDRLAPQDGLYTTIARSGDGERARIIGCVREVLVGAESSEAVVARLAAPQTRIVSLTITEKGYCHDPATGRLRADHPDIVSDLAHPGAPRTAIGVMVAALARRRAAGLAPFTVLCCDNLPANGRLVAGLLRDYAASSDDRLAGWIDRHGACPSTMVDRIVPAMTPDDAALAERLTGLHDAAPVAHEPFRQWVIEDRFVDGSRPAWERAGAEIVTDVGPHEHMKLRVLNASHSALAYLGYLGGHETIGDCVADPPYRRFVEALWREEIIPVTPAPRGIDLAAYTRALLARYDNPAIRHRTWQIAMDGSQKLPQRILATIEARLGKGLAIERLALVVAAWMTYAGGIDEKGRPIDVRDPLAATLRDRLAAAGGDVEARVAALLGIEVVFPQALARSPELRAALVRAARRLAAGGSRATAASSG